MADGRHGQGASIGVEGGDAVGHGRGARRAHADGDEDVEAIAVMPMIRRVGHRANPIRELKPPVRALRSDWLQ